MRKFVVQLIVFAGVVAFGAELKLPDLEPKAYQIGIAPSHITIPTDDLFRHPEQWKEVAGVIQVFKYYGVQAIGVPWARPLPTKLLAEFAKARISSSLASSETSSCPSTSMTPSRRPSPNSNQSTTRVAQWPT